MAIRGRVAFGLVCAERVCHHLGLTGDQVDRVFDDLWRYTSDERLDWWNCKSTAREILETAGGSVSMADCRFLYRVMRQLDEIGGGNLFGGYRNENTLIPSLELCRLLSSRGISIPPTRPFIRGSRRTVLGFTIWSIGFGDPLGRRFDGRELRVLASIDCPR
jgi:hypothetical protein